MIRRSELPAFAPKRIPSHFDFNAGHQPQPQEPAAPFGVCSLLTSHMAAGFACARCHFGDIRRVLMRLVTVKRLRKYLELHPTIAITLVHWTELMRRDEFANLVELRRMLPTGD